MKIKDIQSQYTKLGLAEGDVAKYKDMGATDQTTHFIKNITTGKIVSPHRSLRDAEDSLVGSMRNSNDQFKIVRARKEGVAEGLNEFAQGDFNGGDDSNDLQLYLNVAKKLNMKKYKPSTAHALIAKKMAELVDVVDDDKVDYARHMARKAQGLPNMLEQGVAESGNPEYDDEAGMAQGNLYTIAKAAQGLIDTIDDRDDLPEWVQEKIAKVEGMLVTSWNYMQSQKAQGIDPQVSESICTPDEAEEIFNDFEHSVQARGLSEDIYDTITDDEIIVETAAWRRSAGKSKKGGLNAKGVASYRAEHPGSKLQMAVTTKPSKLKPGSKAAKRRKSFCARMSGNKGPMKKPNGKPTRKALALRKWNC